MAESRAFAAFPASTTVNRSASRGPLSNLATFHILVEIGIADFVLVASGGKTIIIIIINPSNTSLTSADLKKWKHFCWCQL